MATTLDNSGNDRTSPPRPHEEDGRGLGELLRSARERRGLTLEQVSNETKIPRRHLEALESGNPAAVPGGFYRRAQIRTFARAVHLDEGLVLAQLERQAEPPPPTETTPDASAGQRFTSSRNQRVLIFIGVGVAAAVFLRTIGRPLLTGRDNQEQAAADSPRQALPRGAGGDAVVAISQRTQLEPAVATDGLGATTERPEAGAPAVSSGDAAVSTELPKPITANPVSELVVTTEPSGARVTVDGIGWGSTPATIRFLPAGSKRIRVIKDGYQSEERVINTAEGHRSSLDIPLRNTP